MFVHLGQVRGWVASVTSGARDRRSPFSGAAAPADVGPPARDCRSLLARNHRPTRRRVPTDRPSNGPTGLLNLLQPAAYRRFFSSFTSSQSLALLQPGLFRSTSPAFSSSSWSSSALLAAATLLSWRARSRQTRAKGRGWHRRQRRRRRARRRRQLT